MKYQQLLTKDRLGALLLILLGAGIVVHGLRYSLGNLNHMGPGFFPVALGAAQMLIGALLMLTSLHEDTTRRPALPDPRALVCIVAAVLLFVVLGYYTGLALATFFCTLVAALADRNNSLRDAALMGLALVVAATAIFWWALQMQIPLLTWRG